LFILFLLAFVIGMVNVPLHSQSLTLSNAGAIQFNLPGGNAAAQNAPGGDLRLNLSCMPGPGSQTCPTTVSIYVDFPSFCGLQATTGPSSIPASAVVVRVNSGAMIPLDSPAPPTNNGCGAELYTNAAFNPVGTAYPAYMYINLQNIDVPAGVTFQGILTITVDTL